MNHDLKWDVDLESIKDSRFKKVKGRYDTAKMQMESRTANFEIYGLIAKNKSIHDYKRGRKRTRHFSEGTSQYIERKLLADTIQRMPDGDLNTPFDKLSKWSVILEYIFQRKILWSEFEGIDMMSNLTNTWKMSFVYGFAPVRQSFMKDEDDDARVKYNLENWADVFVNPDCNDIRRPEVVYHRSYLSKDDVLALVDDNGEVYDSTYHRDTIRYIIDHDLFTGKNWDSELLADKQKGSTSFKSIELITEYRRGESEFITYCPVVNAVFRTVKNYDPRKGIPWVFMVLETDPDFPLGVPQMEYLIADQQFNDLFQTSAYKNLLLCMEPPIMVAGWETNPSSYRFEPRAVWNLGNNPNQVKVEPVKVDNSIISGWTNTREAVSASMNRSLLVMDGTVAGDSGTTYSKTAPGVEAQQQAKTININQYQKRMEFFISEFANMALRNYINSMGGVHEITVDEETRRRLVDVGAFDIIDGVRISVDFDELKSDLGDGILEFEVKAGSLIQRKEDKERQALTDLVQPFIQNLNGWSDQNKQFIENDILVPVALRILELSDTDIAGAMSRSLKSDFAQQLMSGMQQQIDGQQMQLNDQQMQLDQMQQSLPPQQELQAQQPVPQAPDVQQAQMPPIPQGAMPSQPPAAFDKFADFEVPAQEVNPSDDLLTL